MRKDGQTPALPGMEEIVSPIGVRPGEMDLSDARRYTGEVLYRDHPDVFRAVAAALFLDGLSQRACAARYRVSVNTVRAIRDMALEAAPTEAGRAALFIKSRADKMRGIIRARALDVLLDRLTDEDEARKISVDTLVQLSKLGQDEPAKQPAKSGGSEPEVIDVDEFDAMLDGLDSGKKSAGESVPGDGRSAADPCAETGAECSTGNGPEGVSSFELSEGMPQNKASTQTLCNSSCKSGDSAATSSGLGVTSDESASSPAPLAADGKGPPGGAGVPGGAARPGVD